MQFAFTVPTVLDSLFAAILLYRFCLFYLHRYLFGSICGYCYLRIERFFVLTEKPHQVFSRCGFQVLFDSDGWSLYPPAIFRDFMISEPRNLFPQVLQVYMQPLSYLLGQKKASIGPDRLLSRGRQRHPVVPPGLVQKEHLRSPALFDPLLYPT